MTEEATSLFVDRFYEMDPQFEDVIFGSDLRNGMVVLVADLTMRGNPERMSCDRYEMARCKEANRWCTVTNLHISPRSESEPLARFIGEYGDGTKRARSYSTHWAWIVKRESIADPS